ncbi:hypothetical protein pb186bvf_011636, partial [Paramecium bursaria]
MWVQASSSQLILLLQLIALKKQNRYSIKKKFIMGRRMQRLRESSKAIHYVIANYRKPKGMFSQCSDVFKTTLRMTEVELSAEFDFCIQGELRNFYILGRMSIRQLRKNGVDIQEEGWRYNFSIDIQRNIIRNLVRMNNYSQIGEPKISKTSDQQIQQFFQQIYDRYF